MGTLFCHVANNRAVYIFIKLRSQGAFIKFGEQQLICSCILLLHFISMCVDYKICSDDVKFEH